jgi:hypothetical protein
MEAPNAWARTMAGIAALRSYGEYSGFPAASWKKIGWMPSSMPTASAATVIPM